MTTKMTTTTLVQLVVFGATGHCGRAVVEVAAKWNRQGEKSTDHVPTDEEDRELDRFVGPKSVKFQVTVFCRDEVRARNLFHGKDCHEAIEYMVGDIFHPPDVAAAMEHADVAINCLSSYTAPHTQMSTLIQNILQPNNYKNQKSQSSSSSLRCLIHYGYPRGHEYYNVATNQTIMGTKLEHGITRIVRALSCTKYGPAIRDHDRVLDLLLAAQKQDSEQRRQQHAQQHPRLDYCLFAAPKMIQSKVVSAAATETTTTTKKDSYFGGPESVERGISESRVWHSVSTLDAAHMLLSHVVLVFVTKKKAEGENNKNQMCLPPLVCLSYR
jgi:hypothetical protein